MMTPQRTAALFTIFQNTHCPFVFLNCYSMHNWERSDAPFHPAFEFLSDTHKADYLRCYLMHHYGGGYTDIKQTFARWDNLFETLKNSSKLGLGYTELGPDSVAQLPGELGYELKENYQSLIGLCAFIFKKDTELTNRWYQRTHDLLNCKYDALRANPARHQQDQSGAQFSDGTVSSYPLKWTELLGDIFHPLIYEFRTEIVHGAIAPHFHGYR